MRRREFLKVLAIAAATSPLAAHAQHTQMRRIGTLHGGAETSFTGGPFRTGLREEGFVEGQNVIIDSREARGNYERLPGLAAELVELHVDLIVTFGTPAAHAAKVASAKRTPAVPVVFALGIDPVVDGLVESLNRPGGNLTGITSMTGNLAPKRLDLLSEFLRADAAVAILINPGNPVAQAERRDTEAACRVIGQRLEVLTATNRSEIEQAFAALDRRRHSMLIVTADNFYFTQMQRLATLAARNTVPVIGPLREFSVEGGLVSYGASIFHVNGQAGVLAGKVLKGARPAELPVQQPTHFELVLNLRTAKAQGIEFSNKLLALANEVIE